MTHSDLAGPGIQYLAPFTEDQHTRAVTEVVLGWGCKSIDLRLIETGRRAPAALHVSTWHELLH